MGLKSTGQASLGTADASIHSWGSKLKQWFLLLVSVKVPQTLLHGDISDS